MATILDSRCKFGIHNTATFELISKSGMAEIRLRLPVFWEFEKRHASTVHIVGLDGIPWPCRVSKENAILTISRNRDESGKVFLSYPFEKYGELTIVTGTLPESSTPYDCVTELARGTVNRLRNQTSIWEEGGLEITEEIRRLTNEAIDRLSHSIMTVADSTTVDLEAAQQTKDSSAQESLELGMEAIFELSRVFGDRIASFRASHKEFSSFWFAGSGVEHYGQENEDRQKFDLWETEPFPGKNVYTDDAQRVIYGPFLDASVNGCSTGYDLTETQFEPRRRNLMAYCKKSLNELPSNASLIHAVSGLNGTGHRHLSFPQQLQLTADILNEIEKAETKTPILVSFDYPWAERLASSVGGTHPLQIADSLLRQGVPISYLGLEVNLDYWPTGSVSRDPLQWIDLIDIWSQLGVPLVFLIRVPQQAIAQTSAETKEPEPDEVAKKKMNAVRENLNDQQRRDILETVLPMLIARPNVHGVIWRQWHDNDDLRFPQAGLIDSHGRKKPLLDLIQGVREKILNRN